MTISKNLINPSYFKILQITEYYIELQSLNTSHYWIIKRSQIDGHIALYHKHKKDDYYHVQGNCKNIKIAVLSAKRHDEYILSTRMIINDRNFR